MPIPSIATDLMENSKNAKRRIETKLLSDKKVAIVADYSLVSLASEAKLLNSILGSNHLKDKAVSNQILETNACLGLVSSKHGRFSNYNSGQGF